MWFVKISRLEIIMVVWFAMVSGFVVDAFINSY